jgi:xylose isomerase
MNRNDYQSGWDTDQFPNNVPEMALAYYAILKGGGFPPAVPISTPSCGASRSIPKTCSIAHIGGMDTCARALKAAAKMVEDGVLTASSRSAMPAGTEPKPRRCSTAGSRSEIEEWVRKADINPQPKSGRQEYLENVVNRYV